MALLFKSTSSKHSSSSSSSPAPSSPSLTPASKDNNISVIAPPPQPPLQNRTSSSRHSRIYNQDTTRTSSPVPISNPTLIQSSSTIISTAQPIYQAQLAPPNSSQSPQHHSVAQNQALHYPGRLQNPSAQLPLLRPQQNVELQQQRPQQIPSRRGPPLSLNLGPPPAFSSNITISQRDPLVLQREPQTRLETTTTITTSIPSVSSTKPNISLNSLETPVSPAPTINLPKSMKRKNFKKLSLGSQAAAASPPTPSTYSITTFSSTSSSTLPQSGSPSFFTPSPTPSNNAAGSGVGPTGTSTTYIQLVAPNSQIINSKSKQNPNGLISQMSSLDLGVEFQLDMREEDLELISELGSGNGGTVAKVFHVPTKRLMARKKIPIDPKPEVRRRINKEIRIMNECRSPYIVSFYGFYHSNKHVAICMEYMDKGSLDYISKKKGPLPEPIIGKISVAVVEGLQYLYESHHIMHRDIKPSNVLVNSEGQIKLCDFGVSSELVNSMADTFVGTSIYMSPERICGSQYSIRSDVWSLGLTILELAIGYFPWANRTKKPRGNGDSNEDEDEDDDSDDESDSQRPCGIVDLIHRIVNEPPPTLPPNAPFTKTFRKFVDNCLVRESERPTPKELKNDEFFILSKKNNVRLEIWAQQL